MVKNVDTGFRIWNIRAETLRSASSEKKKNRIVLVEVQDLWWEGKGTL